MRAPLVEMDARLERGVARPLAIALSGGGDSIALLRLTASWAAQAGRPLLALTVDHGLHPDSAAWTAFAADAARRAGADWRALRWAGPKPRTGLPAAARAARHALIAEAARAAGARVVLFAHTADDLAEGRLMRAEGSTLGGLRTWGPSPAWPEGRGVMLLRPLLGQRRAGLRAWLRAQGAAWLEDPSNADPRFARSRARAALAAGQPVPPGEPPSARRPPSGRLAAGAAGELVLAPDQHGWLGEALLCVAGAARPPRQVELDRCRARLEAGAPFRATLAGARLVFDGETLLLSRESGRSGLGEAALPPGRPLVWDGRFVLTAAEPGWRVGAAEGRRAALSRAERAELVATPAPARAGRPVLFRDTDPRPFLARPEVQVRELVSERLRAACGQIAHEADLGPVGHGEAVASGLSFPVAGVSKATVVSSRTV